MTKKPSKTRYVSPPTPCPTEPPDAPNGWWLYLSPQWHAHVQGLVKHLENRALWEGAENEIDDVIGWVQDIEIGGIHVSDMVLDVRAQDGRLEKLVGGMWLDAGDLDDFDVSVHGLSAGQPPTVEWVGNVIDIGIPAGATGATGATGEKGDKGDTGDPGATGAGGSLYSLPEISTDDEYCRAASVLADVLADRLQDNLELIDYTSTVLLQGLDAVLDFIGGFFPVIVPAVDAIVEFNFEVLTEPAIDFVRQNAYDIQARALARDQIYCAMKLAGDPENFWNEIDWLAGLPSRDFDFTNPIKSIWENIDDWIEYIANTANGTNVGWLVLAWGAFVTATIDHLTDQENSVETMVAYALNTASYRDSAICSTAPCEGEWEHIFEFDNSLDGWDSIDAPEPTTHRYNLQSTYIEAGTFNVGGSPPYYKALGTLRKSFAPTELVEVIVEYQMTVAGAVANNTTNQFLKVGSSSKTFIAESGGITTVGWQGQLTSSTIDILMYVATGASGSLPGLARIHKITVSGNGTNPFT